jgi:hypothetical protein
MVQLNCNEKRHQLYRETFHCRRREARKPYREG